MSTIQQVTQQFNEMEIDSIAPSEQKTDPTQGITSTTPLLNPSTVYTCNSCARKFFNHQNLEKHFCFSKIPPEKTPQRS